MAGIKTLPERAWAGIRRWRRSMIRDRLTRRFTKVYEENAWGDEQTRSGPGSRSDARSVAESLEALTTVAGDFGVRSLNDIPCGDFHWIWRFLDRHPAIEYRGFDVVPSIVRANRGKAPKRRFDVLNLVTAVPPPADLVFCKDLLNHLTFNDVANALRNTALSGSKLLLASNNFGHANIDLVSDSDGHSRHLDITAPPLSFPPPIWSTNYLGLWRLSDFKTSI